MGDGDLVGGPRGDEERVNHPGSLVRAVGWYIGEGGYIGEGR